MRKKKKESLYQVTKLDGNEVGIFTKQELCDHFHMQVFDTLKIWINRNRPFKALFYIKSYTKSL